MSSEERYTWSNCNLRSWLNGYGSNENVNEVSYINDNFIDAAFSDEEQKFINDTLLKNANSIKYGTMGGADTIG